MEKIVDVAQYVYKYYLKETDEKIDEMNCINYYILFNVNHMLF